MSGTRGISTQKVVDPAGRELALSVLRATYRDEKQWVDDEAGQVPLSDLADPAISWWVVCKDQAPVGVMRTLYDPPLHLYNEYGLKLVDGLQVDIDEFIRAHRIAEVGRFAVTQEHRSQMLIVAALMRAASTEIAQRGYSHLITDVFENDPHSPYHFHTHVMGFVPVATHETGELNHQGRRITLVLDLKAAYRKLRAANGFIFRFLTSEWDPALHDSLARS